MRVVVQRVKKAAVEVEGKIVGEIKQGLLVLLGVGKDDTPTDADWLLQKIVNQRIFSDDEGKMNRSLLDVQGELLVISQFTLHALTKKGNRPSFIDAAGPDLAIPLYEHFLAQAKEIPNLKVEKGVFGADMQVALVNDGPVTITMDSKNKA